MLVVEEGFKDAKQIDNDIWNIMLENRGYSNMNIDKEKLE